MDRNFDVVEIVFPEDIMDGAVMCGLTMHNMGDEIIATDGKIEHRIHKHGNVLVVRNTGEELIMSVTPIADAVLV